MAVTPPSLHPNSEYFRHDSCCNRNSNAFSTVKQLLLGFDRFPRLGRVVSTSRLEAWSWDVAWLAEIAKEVHGGRSGAVGILVRGS